MDKKRASANPYSVQNGSAATTNSNTFSSSRESSRPPPLSTARVAAYRPAAGSYITSPTSVYPPAQHAHPLQTGRSYTMPHQHSPPASAYFPSFHDPTSPAPDSAPTDDPERHFAYSTTLRRHPTVDGYMPLPPAGTGAGAGHETWVETAQRWLGRGIELTRKIVGLSKPEPVERAPKSHEPTPAAIFSSLPYTAALQEHRSSLSTGLSNAAVHLLRQEHGYNEFEVPDADPMWLKFAMTIWESHLILLLLGSAALSALLGNLDDAASISIAVLIVLTVGFVQERRSEASLAALSKLVPHHCHLLRDSTPLHLLANDLVPGDVVSFSVGDRIPADIRLCETVELEVDESSLTGETRAVRKSPDPVEQGTDLAGRTSVVYLGTLVRNGRGRGVVVGTGTQTEFGRIFELMQSVEERRTPLQLSMDDLAKRLSVFSFGVIGFIVLVGVLQSRGWLEMFTIGVSLAVAAIPEGLPIVTTVTLALGVLRMSNRKAIVKKLPSVEALGSISVVCSDKTGTLTKNEMTVTEIYTVDELTSVSDIAAAGVGPTQRLLPAVHQTLRIGSLCNNAFRNEEGVFVGQSTEVALLNVLEAFGLDDPRMNFQRLSERPFSSEQKYMAVSGAFSSSADARECLYLKGSLEAVLSRCKTYYVTEGSTPPLDANMHSIIHAKAAQVAHHGLRIVAMAYAVGPATAVDLDNPERCALTFAGFQGMLDPPRKGVSDAISLLRQGGIRVVMITGDAENTATSIARQLGIPVGGGRTSVLTGSEMDEMSERSLSERITSITVFARTTPRHKIRIVQALQERGQVVAMTGDGVNDAPALKGADIGVSMGRSGTDVAKEAADVILVDDNFATILPAVEEGKSIFHNIQNFLTFQLSTAVAALTLITLSTTFHLANPLNAMQILFINILMDGPPSQSLGVDPVDKAVMKKPPRAKDAPIITRRLLARVLFSASMIVLGTLFVYMHELSDGRMSKRDQTMTFTSFVFLDLVSAIQNRGLNCGLTQNKMLLTTVSISFLVQLTLIYVPVMQAIFQTESLPNRDMLTLFALAGTSFAVHEVRRRYERRLNEGVVYSPMDMEDIA
ncbi:calcium-transporting P [Dacryopinax primogenitus]|uniref:Calcium-transporting ATPase n=1 Tax=Dacryopinax primogenitus (strain DJM 731) TaxID=1858805 RepID=M5FZT4_DACPD|nr:calcium-transporting P [Dacryopinax primogenitus]EJT97022.1 calcium-transporting P [Dacryopinax primogenitus]